MTIILGIDPGSCSMGYGLIACHSAHSHYLASGCITPSTPSSSLPDLFNSLQKLIEQYQPQEAAIEQVFFYRNPKSALILGQVRGVALLAMGLSQLPTYHYAARQIKQMITGFGAASKEQIQGMVQRLLKLNAKPSQDAADALAIALCRAQSQLDFSALPSSIVCNKRSKIPPFRGQHRAGRWR